MAIQAWPAANEDREFRVASWNISGDSHVTDADLFHAMMKHMNPDVLVLDEVLPNTSVAQLQDALAGIDPEDNRPWNVSFGASGGRQRCVIASQWPIEDSFVFSRVIPYPEKERQIIGAQMTTQDHLFIRYSMEGGIPVNGAVVNVSGRRLLAVSVDLQCCGGATDDWQEYRRNVEARVIRNLTRRALKIHKVDGAIVAGDLNTVGTLEPIAVLKGLKKSAVDHMQTVEIFRSDGETSWTWDGRGTPFPSGILDYQLYGVARLRVSAAYIFDTEDMDAGTLQSLGLHANSSSQLSRHRPLVVDYSWRE